MYILFCWGGGGGGGGGGEEIIGWRCRDEPLWYSTLFSGYFCNLVISKTIINILLCKSISNIVKV